VAIIAHERFPSTQRKSARGGASSACFGSRAGGHVGRSGGVHFQRRGEENAEKGSGAEGASSQQSAYAGRVDFLCALFASALAQRPRSGDVAPSKPAVLVTMSPHFSEEVRRARVHRRVLGLEQESTLATVAACAPNAEGKRTPRRE